MLHANSIKLLDAKINHLILKILCYAVSHPAQTSHLKPKYKQIFTLIGNKQNTKRTPAIPFVQVSPALFFIYCRISVKTHMIKHAKNASTVKTLIKFGFGS